MKFNTSNSANRTVNMAGGEAFTQSPEMEFISLLLTSFVQDQFYRSENDTLEKVAELVSKLDKKFCAKAALYARREFGMRSISHAVAGEIAKQVHGEQWTKNFFDKIVYRPDDMMEILAYYYANGKQTEPNALKKGFAKALLRFNEYQLSKYKKTEANISLVDIVNLVHPKHNDTIAKLVNRTLKSPETWEVELSATKGDDEAKKRVWTKLVKERKIGYFALLRNLRNILEQAPELVDEACNLLTDEKMIKKSLVLPFRFLTALKQLEEISGSRKIIIALNKAVDISLSNVPKLDGDTLVVLDTSGSMDGKPAEIGSLFSAILVKSNESDFMVFSDDATYQTLNPMDSTITIARNIDFMGGGTDFNSIFETANKSYDRIIILSDMQGWIGYYAPNQAFAQYKLRTGSNPKIYSFDLQGYGTLEFPEQNIYCLAGFSEKIFDIMKLLESDKKALITKINQIEL